MGRKNFPGERYRKDAEVIDPFGGPLVTGDRVVPFLDNHAFHSKSCAIICRRIRRRRW